MPHALPPSAASSAQQPIQCVRNKRKREGSEKKGEKEKEEKEEKEEGREKKRRKIEIKERPRTLPRPDFDPASLPVLKGPPSSRTPIKDVRVDKWRSLVKDAQQKGFSANRHFFKYGGGVEASLVLTHTHGNFEHKVPTRGNQAELPYPNISTKRAGAGRASSHPKLWDAFSDKPAGARDVLRILKGTHLSSGLKTGLTTKSEPEAQAATELAVELGVSEGARGGELGLVQAATALYLVKHGHLRPEQFYSQGEGFVGSQGGGAEELRKLTPEKVHDFHSDLTGERFKDVQKGAKAEKWASKSYQNWIGHKWNKWRQRY